MILLELFNNAPHFNVTDDTEGRWAAHAKINGRWIEFLATKLHDSWNLEFSEMSEQHGHRTFKKTGSGGEFAVFGMVRAALHRFIEEHDHPGELNFTCERDRVDLYKKLFKLPGYKLSCALPDGSAKYHFVLEKL